VNAGQSQRLFLLQIEQIHADRVERDIAKVVATLLRQGADGATDMLPQMDGWGQ
jgi:hypothetical protein